MSSSSCYCILLRKASRRLSALYDAALQPFGINIGQFSLMRNINRNQPVSLTDLGTMMELDRSTVGRNTKVLERMGLVEAVAGEDQREALLQLSDKGRALLDASVPVWEDVQVRIDERLGESRTEELKQLLEVL
ncbi:MAG: MarR family transcriptional regulator [Rhizobium sp.]|nr:MarR family transcriptional regulator [Rhizobium sp.]